ncbi:MAG: hypothetical protein ACRDN0_03935 [Trebonia sp.]
MTGLHLGAADTDMMAGSQDPMVDPRDVARAALDGTERDAVEVLADERSVNIKAALALSPADNPFYAAG